VETVSDSWGAYRIEPKPELNDILHIYADNVVFIETDLGEKAEMTLEDGRRNLFWGKDYQLLSEWAAERKPVPCEEATTPDFSLMNVGVALSTTIPPDSTGEAQPVQIQIAASGSGNLTVSGTAEAAGSLILERTTSMAPPIAWQPAQTNTVSAGPFSFVIPRGTEPAVFFRVRVMP
jgi:hypothetical protein